MTHDQTSNNQNRILALRLKKNKEDMKHQVISFLLMLILTILAFFVVGNEEFTKLFKAPFIILLAMVQVLFQLFYFMHMKHQGHEAPSLFLFSGIGFSLIMTWTFLTIIWW